MRRLPGKQLGEAVEARFLDAALFLGFIVARLWGDSRPFEFYVANGDNKRPYRVQVKATSVVNGSGYLVQCKHGAVSRPYTSKETDFVAAYVVPMQTWYIIPVKAVSHTTSVTVFPTVRNSRGKYERYRENWDLLRR